VSILKFLRRKITKDESRDTGMAMVLLLLILWLPLNRRELILGALALQALGMSVPQLFRPLAVLWLGLSNLIGEVVSRILMFIVFFVVVTPIGIVRKLSGKDSLKLRTFKAGKDSVMLTRNHAFSASDLERPY
jgi:hypothetical protein